MQFTPVSSCLNSSHVSLNHTTQSTKEQKMSATGLSSISGTCLDIIQPKEEVDAYTLEYQGTCLSHVSNTAVKAARAAAVVAALAGDQVYLDALNLTPPETLAAILIEYPEVRAVLHVDALADADAIPEAEYLDQRTF